MKIYTITFFTAFLFVIVLGFMPVSQAGCTGTCLFQQSGAACEAANLNQALQGLDKDQFGIVNNNATKSFFVVCPVLVDGNRNLLNVTVSAIFPGSGQIECVWRSVNYQTGSFVSASMTIISGSALSDSNHGSNSIVDATGFAPPTISNDHNSSLVCALDPGEGINAFYPQQS